MSSLNNRKELIIDPKLQYRIMAMLISAGVCVCLVFLAGLYYFIEVLFDILNNAVEVSINTKIILFTKWNEMLYVLIALVGVTIFGTWLWAKAFTNKIAGPIFNITRTLDTYIAGDTTARIKLREKDYFNKLAERINLILARTK